MSMNQGCYKTDMLKNVLIKICRSVWYSFSLANGPIFIIRSSFLISVYLNPLGQVYNQHLSQVWWHKLKVCFIGYVTAYVRDNRLPIYKAWVISSVPATQQPLN